jgi:putative ABC transport system permease protein
VENVSYYVRLAGKNLFRNKLRSFVALVVIAIAVMIVVLMRGSIQGFVNNAYSSQVQYKTGHIRVIDKEYRQQERLLPLNYPVTGFKEAGISQMVEELESIEGVKMAVPRIKFGASVASEEELVKMIGWGVNPQKEVKFTDIEEHLTEGRMVEPGATEVVMGVGLLDKLNRSVGEKVTILYNDSLNSFKGMTFEIVDSFKSGSKMLDDKVFYTSLTKAQDMLYMDQWATELLLVTPDLNQVDSVMPRVEEVFAENKGETDYALIPWFEAGGMIGMAQLSQKLYNFIYICLVVLASFVVINTMMMIVKERTQEIGMMTALGLEEGDILKLFLIEGIIMGGIGSLIGALLGGGITRVLAEVGINFGAELENMGSGLVNPVVYPVFSIENMLFGFGLGVVITALACIIPARKAAKLEPTKALRKIEQ